MLIVAKNQTILQFIYDKKKEGYEKITPEVDPNLVIVR